MFFFYRRLMSLVNNKRMPLKNFGEENVSGPLPPENRQVLPFFFRQISRAMFNAFSLTLTVAF